MATTPRFSWAKTRLRIEEFGSAEAVLRLKFSNELLDDGFDQEIRTASQAIDSYEAQGFHLSTIRGDGYPRQLRTVHDAPPVLWWQGFHDVGDEDSVAIVGTRAPDEWGKEFARSLARLLAIQGVPVVSGLARGIDGVAMRASLEAGGRTIGVIGAGLGVYYPPEHRDLQDEVANSLLLSQFAPGTAVSKPKFPMRNITMSGFASLTVIVQAGETSGTMHQAKAAVKHGRPVIITSQVLRSAGWARDLKREGYEVTVVDTPREAFTAVQEIHRSRRAAAGDWGFGTLLRA
ncbi:DNA processing protein [Paramicrobacterium humi]|uniref:DNA processing protein n=2 Tax=Paramicrobacterium humi TaxID=640635 RepID=A0A1H4K2F2_9MICO|nr:DNA processing protein [Microbacterium humi]